MPFLAPRPGRPNAAPAALPMTALRTFLLDLLSDAEISPIVPPTTAPVGTAPDLKSTSRAPETTPYWTLMLWPARCARTGSTTTAVVSAATSAAIFGMEILVMIVRPPVPVEFRVGNRLFFARSDRRSSAGLHCEP